MSSAAALALTRMDTHEIRRSFIDFYARRGHEVVGSSSLIPNDRSLLLTTAGMVQFKPYLVGDEPAPYPRATSVQKCARTTDIDVVGTTERHLTFFEMLGNFSLGDYFKSDAIPWAWELITDVFGFDPDALWVTIHETDDEAAEIWLDGVGLDPGRLQRLDEDNFWSMGQSGPCGPSSEIFVDRGPAHGRDGGPTVDDERFVEIYNLVFMQYLRDDDGQIVGELPKPSIDTGAGLERLAAACNGLGSVFEVDTIRAVMSIAESASGRRYGHDPGVDVSLRLLADHGRSATFLTTDGVFPSNEDRGYVLRRILRRAVRHAWLLGVDDLILPRLATEVVATLGDVYPELRRAESTTTAVLANEEERFRRTLEAGLSQLDEAFDDDSAWLSGSVAFKLHDTFGFPIELTREIAGERGVEVDDAGFATEMAAQQERARRANDGAKPDRDSVDAYRKLAHDCRPTEFLGYETTSAEAKIEAIIVDGELVEGVEAPSHAEIFADRTPFYAEGGGQVGDTGTITTSRCHVEVIDTQSSVAGLIGHRAQLVEGSIHVGEVATFEVDEARRNGIRKHHTGTHLLHWALREVLGSHVRQQGSLVEPDRLRFDFSHYAPVTRDEIETIEALANREVITNAPVLNYETSKAEADADGVISFFGDKYGSRVRVLEAGAHSKELCGGTHVASLSEIGSLVVVSESSIGSNLRRIEALCGAAAFDYLQSRRHAVSDIAIALRTAESDVVRAVERKIADVAALKKDIDDLNAELATGRAGDLESDAFRLDGDGRALIAAIADVGSPKDLQRLAAELRGRLSPSVVVLGASIAGKASLVAAVSPALRERGLSAAEVVRPAAKVVGGGTGRNADVAVAGGPKGEFVEEALGVARSYLESWTPAYGEP